MAIGILEKWVQWAKHLWARLYSKTNALLLAWVLATTIPTFAENHDTWDQNNKLKTYIEDLNEKPVLNNIKQIDVDTQLNRLNSFNESTESAFFIEKNEWEVLDMNDMDIDLTDGDPILWGKSAQEMMSELNEGNLTLTIDGEEISFSWFDRVELPHEKTITLADGTHPQLDRSWRVQWFVSIDNWWSLIISTDGFLMWTFFSDSGREFQVQKDDWVYTIKEIWNTSSGWHEHHEWCNWAEHINLTDEQNEKYLEKIYVDNQSVQLRGPAEGAYQRNLVYNNSAYAYLNNDPTIAATHSSTVLAGALGIISPVGTSNLQMYNKNIQLGNLVLDETDPSVALSNAVAHRTANPIPQTTVPLTLEWSTMYFTGVNLTWVVGISQGWVEVTPGGATIPSACQLLWGPSVSVVEIWASSDANVVYHEWPFGHMAVATNVDIWDWWWHSGIPNSIMYSSISPSATLNQRTIDQYIGTQGTIEFFMANQPWCLHELPTPLLIELTDLSSNLEDCVYYTLTAKTASETNNEYVIWKVWFDGTHFQEIGRLEWAWNISSENTYRFEVNLEEVEGYTSDTDVVYGMVADISTDGEITNSPIISETIDKNCANVSLKCFPNPSTESVSYTITWIEDFDGMSYEMINVLWKKVNEGEIDSWIWTISLTSLSKWTYFLNVLDHDGRRLTWFDSKKIVKQ